MDAKWFNPELHKKFQNYWSNKNIYRIYLLQLKYISGLNQSPNNCLKMFTIFGLDQNPCQNYQTLIEAFLGSLKNILLVDPSFQRSARVC